MNKQIIKQDKNKDKNISQVTYWLNESKAIAEINFAVIMYDPFDMFKP